MIKFASSQWRTAMGDPDCNGDGYPSIGAYIDPRCVDYAPIGGTETYYTNLATDPVNGEFSLDQSTVYMPFPFSYPITFECMVKPQFAYDVASDQEFCKFYCDAYDGAKIAFCYYSGTDQLGVKIYQNIAGGGGGSITSVDTKLARVYTSNATLQEWIRLTCVLTATAISIYANGSLVISSAVTMSGIRKLVFLSPGNNVDCLINYIKIFPGLTATAAQIINGFCEIKSEQVLFDFQKVSVGRTRCDITYPYLKSFSQQAGDNYGAAQATMRLESYSGEFADDQYAAYAPESGSYNGTSAQKYLTKSFRVHMEERSRQKYNYNNTGTTIAYYSFDGASTTFAKDDGGNQNHLVLTNTPTVGAAKHGNGLYFDGVNEYGECTGIQQLTTDDSITVAAFIKIPAAWTWDTTNRNMIFGIGNGVGCLGIVNFTTDNIIMGTLRDSGGSKNTSQYTIARDTWYHVAVVYTGSTRILQLYVNGVAIGESPAAATGENLDTVISAGGIYASSGTGSYTEMYIDEAFIDKKAWTAANVLGYLAAIESPAYALTTDARSERTFTGSVDAGSLKRSTPHDGISTFTIQADDFVKMMARRKVRNARVWEDYYLSRETPSSDSVWHELAWLASKREIYNYLGNSGFENATIGNSWLATGTGVSLTRNNVIPLIGTYSALVTTSSGNSTVYQTAIIEVSKGDVLTFQAYLRTGTPGQTIDMTITEYEDAVAGTSTTVQYSYLDRWQLGYVTHTVADNATNRIRCTFTNTASTRLDCTMLTFGEVKYFYIANTNDGTSGVIDSSLAQLGTYEQIGLVSEDVPFQHPWPRIAKGMSAWERMKEVADASLCRRMHITQANVLHMDSYMVSADETVSRGTLAQAYNLEHYTQPTTANKINVSGVYIHKADHPVCLWEAKSANIENESTNADRFKVALVDTETYPSANYPDGLECVYDDALKGFSVGFQGGGR